MKHLKKGKARPPITRKQRRYRHYMVLEKGIEPPTHALRMRCSTPELHQQILLTPSIIEKLKICFNPKIKLPIFTIWC